MSTRALMSVEQFAQTITVDIGNYELVEGELLPLPTGTYRHNKIRDLIGHLLWSYFKGNPIGEAVGENDCQIASDTVRRPDVSVFLGPRARQSDPDKIPAPFAPDIAVEVLSRLKVPGHAPQGPRVSACGQQGSVAPGPS